MKTHECTPELVTNDLSRHEMRVVRDDGIHRHIRFRRPDSSPYWFDLITWPGTLCINGDCGTYVFSRLDDMFEFFRTDRRDGKLRINPGYWGEKLQAVARHGGHTEFDEDRFDRVIKEHLVRWMRDHRIMLTKDQRRELWDAVEDEVLRTDSDRKQAAAYEFHHSINGNVRSFRFEDFWEHDVERYTFHFIWCCYAIAWGIELYDSIKSEGQKANAA